VLCVIRRCAAQLLNGCSAACRALTKYLGQPEVLQTPGLFVNRADHMSLEVVDESKIVRCVLVSHSPAICDTQG
jgi:hypothetical protein